MNTYGNNRTYGILTTVAEPVGAVGFEHFARGGDLHGDGLVEEGELRYPFAVADAVGQGDLSWHGYRFNSSLSALFL